MRHAFAVLIATILGCGGRFADVDVAPDPDASPPPAPLADPFGPGQDWFGTYTCAQGLTNLDLRIVATDGDTIDDALFLFDWSGVKGSYHMTGTFDAQTGVAVLTPTKWIHQPASNWYMVGMSGIVQDNRYAGGITDDACGRFAVTR